MTKYYVRGVELGKAIIKSGREHIRILLKCLLVAVLALCSGLALGFNTIY